MARIRTIKPEFTLDEELSECSINARYFFENLWCHCDREGCAEDRPKKLKALIFPWDDVDVEKLLEELSPKFILRYEVEGRKYIQVITFKKHQRPNIKECESTIPKPPSTLKHVQKSVGTNEAHLSTLDKGKGNGVREGNGVLAQSPSNGKASELEPGIPFPVVGNGTKEWKLTVPKLEEYKEAYPNVDLRIEIPKMRQWCIDNPIKRKTPRGMPAFINRWLSREQNRGGNHERH